MAKKKFSLSDADIIHVIDMTLGMEDNVDLLMCGKKIGDLGEGHYAMNPTHENMPDVCDKADKEGRMCEDCKRGITYYAKGVYKGEMQQKMQFVKDLMGAVEGAKEHVTTH